MEIGLGDDLAIRSWCEGDQQSLVRYADNRRVSRNLRDRFPYPYTPADADDWIARVIVTRPEMNFAIARAGEAIGGIGLMAGDDVHAHMAEIGYWLGEPFWGRGIVTRAVRAMTRHAFEVMDFERLWAVVFEGNDASMRVLEKCGYTLEGRLRRSIRKDGRIMDSFLYAVVRAGGES